MNKDIHYFFIIKKYYLLGHKTFYIILYQVLIIFYTFNDIFTNAMFSAKINLINCINNIKLNCKTIKKHKIKYNIDIPDRPFSRRMVICVQ